MVFICFDDKTRRQRESVCCDIELRDANFLRGARERGHDFYRTEVICLSRNSDMNSYKILPVLVFRCITSRLNTIGMPTNLSVDPLRRFTNVKAMVSYLQKVND